MLTSINTLPMMRFEGLPATVYVRAFFVDNPIAFLTQNLIWGTWIGGIDLSSGITGPDQPLDAVSLPAGQGTNLTLSMVALRRLTVSMTLAPGTMPLDDGEGPATFASFRSATPMAGSAVTGLGTAECRRIGVARPGLVTGFVIGSGNHFVSAGLNDFGTDFDPNPGSIVSLDFSGPTPAIPAANMVSFAPTQYSAAVSVQLNFVEPLNADAGAPTPLSCSSLLDAGTD